MSALSEYLNDEKYEPELYDDDGWKLLDQARAELAQLRDDSLLLIGSNRLLNEIGAALNCAPDATILDRIGVLNDTLAEQAQQLDKARKVICSYRALHLGPAGYCSYPLIEQHEIASNWLANFYAANPAPEAEAQP